MRIVLDTNCLIQSIPERSPYHGVWLSFEKGDNTLCVSNEIIPYPTIDVISIVDFLKLIQT